MSGIPKTNETRFDVTREEHQEIVDNAFDNLNAFRPDDTRKCEVCYASPVVNATGLCGPCTFGEADTINGDWWDDEDERRWQELKDVRNTANKQDREETS